MRSEDVPYLHDKEDRDRSPLAGHHTIGLGENNFVAGNHNHNFKDVGSLPIFPPIDIPDPLDPQEGLDIIWDWMEDLGAIIIRPEGGGLFGEVWWRGIPQDNPILFRPLFEPETVKWLALPVGSQTRDYDGGATPGWSFVPNKTRPWTSGFSFTDTDEIIIGGDFSRVNYDAATDSFDWDNNSLGSHLIYMAKDGPVYNHTYEWDDFPPGPVSGMDINTFVDIGFGYAFAEETQELWGLLPQPVKRRTVIYNMRTSPPTEVVSNGWVDPSTGTNNHVLSDNNSSRTLYPAGPNLWWAYAKEGTVSEGNIFVWNLSPAGWQIWNYYPAIPDVDSFWIWERTNSWPTYGAEIWRRGTGPPDYETIYQIRNMATGEVGPEWTMFDIGLPDPPDGTSAVEGARGWWSGLDFGLHTTDSNVLPFNAYQYSVAPDGPKNIFGLILPPGITDAIPQITFLRAVYFGYTGDDLNDRNGQIHMYADGTWVMAGDKSFGSFNTYYYTFKSTNDPVGALRRKPYHDRVHVNTKNPDYVVQTYFGRIDNFQMASAANWFGLPIYTTPDYPTDPDTFGDKGNTVFQWWGMTGTPGTPKTYAQLIIDGEISNP